ncbi:MAG TPA: DMT family transporter [Chloroflexota bacterium]|nr:DMT family transporter [Chloroflexota bacterium]
MPLEWLALVAAFSSALAHLASKKAVGAASPPAFLAARWTTGALVMTTVLLVGPGWGGYAPSGSLAALAAGAVLGPVVGWLLYLRALPRLDVSVAQPIFSSSVLVTMALAVAFLGEQPNAFTLAGAALIVGGVQLLQGVQASRQPKLSRWQRLRHPAVLLVLGGACCLGVSSFCFKLGLNALTPVETNWVRTTVPAMVLLGGNTLGALRGAALQRAGAPGVGSAKGVWLTWRGLGWAALASLANDVVGWLLRFVALKHGLVVVVEPLASTGPLFVALLATTLLGERLGRRGWLGVGCTVVGAVLLAGWGR